MEFPPEHYEMEKCEEEILGLVTEEDILWTFEYGANLTELTSEELSSITESLNIPDGVTIFHIGENMSSSLIFLEYRPKIGLFEVESKHCLYYAERVELKAKGKEVTLCGYFGDRPSFVILVETLEESQHRFDFLEYEYSESI